MNNSVVEEHIKNFIKNFVFGNKQERARLKLLPFNESEWGEVSLKLVTWLDFKRCAKLTSIEKSPESLRNKYGNKAGLYLDFSSEPRNLTLSEAAAIHFRAALFSMDCGKLVFFFTHDDDVYVCKAA